MASHMASLGTNTRPRLHLTATRPLHLIAAIDPIWKGSFGINSLMKFKDIIAIGDVLRASKVPPSSSAAGVDAASEVTAPVMQTMPGGEIVSLAT